MMRKLKKNNRFEPWLIPIAVIGVWELAARYGLAKPTFIPAPSVVGMSLISLVVSGELLSNLLASLTRVLYGFALAAVLGITVGLSAGYSKRFERLIDPLIQLLRPIPPIAWIPLLILWLGIDEAPKVAIITLGAFFPIFLNTVHGIKEIDPKLVEVTKVLDIKRAKILSILTIPSALSSIITGLRIGLGVAWMCVVAAELIAATSGLGYMITDARQLSRPDVVIVGMLAIGLIGKLMDSAIRRIERLALGWRFLSPELSRSDLPASTELLVSSGYEREAAGVE